VYVTVRDSSGIALPRLGADAGTPAARIGPIRLTPGKREAIKQVLRGNVGDIRTFLLALLLL
jgi:hypothetical protein